MYRVQAVRSTNVGASVEFPVSMGRAIEASNAVSQIKKAV